MFSDNVVTYRWLIENQSLRPEDATYGEYIKNRFDDTAIERGTIRMGLKESDRI